MLFLLLILSFLSSHLKAYRSSPCGTSEPYGRGKVDAEEGAATHMARDFAAGFYNSPAWKSTRDEYKRSRGGLCEICYAAGIAKAGVIVHHKTELTPDNITDPEIALSWDNLQLVCRDCHAAIHERQRNRRYKLDELGRVVFLR